MLCIDLRIIKIISNKIAPLVRSKFGLYAQVKISCQAIFFDLFKKSKMSVSAGRQDLTLAIAFKLNNANGFGDLTDAENIVEI